MATEQRRPAEPPGQLELIPVAPGKPCTSYRVVTFDPASGCEIAPRGFQKFSDAIRDLPIAAGRAAAAAAELGETVWILGADGTSCEVTPTGDVAPHLGWALLAARVLDNRKDHPLMATKTQTDDEPRLERIPLTELRHHPDNIRHDLGDLTDLIKSIEGSGVQNPGLVLPKNDEGFYDVVAGNRRFEASVRADGVDDMPCVVRAMTLPQVLETMLVENTQRADITPVEEARAFSKLMDLKTTVADIARTVGRTQKYVKSRLALMALPVDVLDLVHAGNISLGNAEALLPYAADQDAMRWVVDNRSKATGSPWGNAAGAVLNYVSERDRKAVMAAAKAEAAAAGVKAFDGWWNQPAGLGRLDRRTPLTLLKLTAAQARKHTDEPCHEVHLRELRHYDETSRRTTFTVETTPICSNPIRHTTADDEALRSSIQMKPATYAQHLADDAPDPEELERQATEKARTEAKAKRRDFTQTLLITGTPPAIDPITATALLAFVDNTEMAADIVDGWLLQPGDDEHTDWQLLRWESWVSNPDQNARAVWALILFQGENNLQVLASGRTWWGNQDLAETNALTYIEHLTAAGYELSDIEAADVDAIRQTITERAEARAAEAATAQQRADDEANPTAEIATARLAELTPDGLIAFAELLDHLAMFGTDPLAPGGVYIEESHLNELGKTGLVSRTNTDDGVDFNLTDFATKVAELLGHGQPNSEFTKLVDEAASIAGAVA